MVMTSIQLSINFRASQIILFLILMNMLVFELYFTCDIACQHGTIYIVASTWCSLSTYLKAGCHMEKTSLIRQDIIHVNA